MCVGEGAGFQVVAGFTLSEDISLVEGLFDAFFFMGMSCRLSCSPNPNHSFSTSGIHWYDNYDDDDKRKTQVVNNKSIHVGLLKINLLIIYIK